MYSRLDVLDALCRILFPPLWILSISTLAHSPIVYVLYNSVQLQVITNPQWLWHEKEGLYSSCKGSPRESVQGEKDSVWNRKGKTSLRKISWGSQMALPLTPWRPDHSPTIICNHNGSWGVSLTADSMLPTEIQGNQEVLGNKYRSLS